jgi:hypothetical protein
MDGKKPRPGVGGDRLRITFALLTWGGLGSYPGILGVARAVTEGLTRKSSAVEHR